MTILWLIEMQQPFSKEWEPIWCYFNYDEALESVRSDNREQRPLHRFKYRLSRLICNETLVPLRRYSKPKITCYDSSSCDQV